MKIFLRCFFFHLSFFGVTLTLLPWFWFRFHDVPHLLYAIAVNIFFWIAIIPDLKMYVAYKRFGEFDKAGNRFAGLDSEFTLGPIIKLAERFGWKKSSKRKSDTGDV